MDKLLPALSEAELAQVLPTVTDLDLVAVTLADGNVLLGGILRPPWGGERSIVLSFNSRKGGRHGLAHVVELPPQLVAGIAVVPLSDAAVPRMRRDDPEVDFLNRILTHDASRGIDLPLAPRDYPNPLASIISDHNLCIASSHNLPLSVLMQEALSQDGVPPDGIHFDGDVLLYADWDFFLREASGPVAVSAGIPGVLGIQKQTTPSLQSQVLQRLRSSPPRRLADALRRRISPTIGEDTLLGTLEILPAAQTTQLEGDDCEVVLVRDPDSGEALPVLIKLGSLSYPREFLALVKSKLAFYGEIKPIPLRLLGEDYKSALLARAIAYLHNPS